MRRLPLILATALLATPLFPGGAEAVKSGRYQGPEISFRIKDDKISKLVFTAVNSCQTVGSGDLPDGDIQSWSPPGGFKILRNDKFSGSRYVMRTNDFFDIRFYWRGRFRNGKMTARVQTSYKFYDSESRPVHCYGENVFRAKRRFMR
jgi:hypothetical protein